jgi:hypothetical protein
MLGWLSKLVRSAGSLLLAVPVFASAGLLLAIEPMLAKLLLPTFGGSPATWAACMVAFQLLLLGGYGYAHLGARYLDVRRQAALHIALLVAAAVFLLQSRPGAVPELGNLPWALAVPWLVVRRIGLPYFALASTAPLLARFAPSLGRASHALYAVSNAGALLGLLAYPFVLERFVALPVQLALWAAGFLLFGLSLLPVCVAASRARAATGSVASVAWVASVTSRRRRLHWLACAFVPSAMLLAVTNYITIDVAATPLLWVVPLALYLTSFIVAFSALNVVLRGGALVLWTVGSLWLSRNAFAQGTVPLLSQVTPALLALFGTSLLCHGDLARSRPDGAEPTGYFLILASGGVLGGAFVSLLAPLLFSDFYELEVASVGTFLLLLLAARRRDAGAFARPSRLLVYLGCGVCLPLIVGETWIRHARSGHEGRIVERRRGFLGPLRVVDVADGRVLTHGRIQHGMQLRAPGQRRVATMYFGAGTGIQRVLDGIRLDRPRRLGVVGLGVGTLASYGLRGDRLRFFELDPNVIELARRDFTFLADSAASITIVPGDGRLALGREASQAFDVLVLDAFSSDAVPVHLLTRQAFELYTQKLAPGGVLLANVSNRHLAVDRVVRASARSVGLSCAVVETRGHALGHVVHVVWAVMAHDEALVTRLLGNLPLKPDNEPEILWTDSHASVLSVLR